jgi:ParB family chromosome partitioning protein
VDGDAVCGVAFLGRSGDGVSAAEKIEDARGRVPRRDVFIGHDSDVTIIGLDTPDGPEHPLYDPRITLPITDDDLASVAEYGVKQPVLCWRNPETKRVELIDGIQRTRWVRKLNETRKAGEKIRLPRLTEAGLTQEQAIDLKVVLNAFRKDNDHIARGAIVEHLQKMGRTRERIRLLLNGVSLVSIDNWHRLYKKGIPALHAAVRDGSCQPSAGWEIAKGTPEQQELALERIRAHMSGASAASQNAGNTAPSNATPSGSGPKVPLKPPPVKDTAADAASDRGADKIKPPSKRVMLALVEHSPAMVADVLEWVCGKKRLPEGAWFEEAAQAVGIAALKSDGASDGG